MREERGNQMKSLRRGNLCSNEKEVEIMRNLHMHLDLKRISILASKGIRLRRSMIKKS